MWLTCVHVYSHVSYSQDIRSCCLSFSGVVTWPVNVVACVCSRPAVLGPFTERLDAQRFTANVSRS